MLKTDLANNIFKQKYALTPNQTWRDKAISIVEDVCGPDSTNTVLMPRLERDYLAKAIEECKFIPGGRYIYYAGRKAKFYNNCYLLRGKEDTREEWARLSHAAMSMLSCGGGIGVDYSIFRERGRLLSRTGGTASGPISLMKAINEIGRHVMQGGSRRSAIYASLNWKHPDVEEFLSSKNWHDLDVVDGYTAAEVKKHNFNFPAPLDMTNISLNYDNAFLAALKDSLPETFVNNVRQALSTGEPGFSFNFGDKENETLRNAPCVDSTWVLTSQGYKQIKDIAYVPVVVWTGKQWTKTTFTKTRENDEVVTVTLTGRREITCSKDHPFVTKDWTKVNAESLEIGTEILFSPGVIEGGRSVEEAYLLAFIYGDGGFHTRYPRAEVALCGGKEKLLPYLSTLPCEISKDKRGILRVYYKSHDIFRSRDKVVFPEEVYSWDYDSRVKFLSGLLDADGNDHGGVARLGSTRFGFLQGVQRLCDTLGLTSAINKGSVCGYSGNPSWQLSIKGNTGDVLQTHRLTEIKNWPAIKYKVVSIEETGNEDVYCCDVGVEEHSFQAEGVIISNCTEVTSEDDSDVLSYSTF